MYFFHIPLPLGERLGEGDVTREDYDSTRARELQRNGGRAEQKIWELLRSRRISGAKFRRQHPIGPYFADVACIARKLVIEVDGDHHAFQLEADARSTAVMAREGWKVVRFWANQVVQNPEGTWAEIEIVLNGRPPHLTSPPKGERNMKERGRE
jgi:very-short-patch-repair endonuclease